MALKQQAIIRPSGDGFVVAVNGKVVRGGFATRALACMWAARQKIYARKTPRRVKPPLPPALEDLSIKPTRLLAELDGQAHWRFMLDARAGKYGPLYPCGRGEGLMFGEWKRGRAARAIKTT
jgi:hypothetical protein